jgi:hypothetical protein
MCEIETEINGQRRKRGEEREREREGFAPSSVMLTGATHENTHVTIV